MGVLMPDVRYPTRGAQSERDRLIHEFGEATVYRAENAVMITILIKIGVVNPTEFLDMVRHSCRTIDERRRQQVDPEGKLLES